jgi:hypothetical protein
LPNCVYAVYYVPKRWITTSNIATNQRGDIMAEEKVQDYTDDKNEGHVDTREKKL